MSGHEKDQDSYVYDYTSTRPDREQHYAGSTQPLFSSHYPSSHVDESHALVSTTQVPYLGHPRFQSRDTGYQAGAASLIDAEISRSSPEVISTGPFTGIPGEALRLSVRSKYDYLEQNFTISLLFGGIAVPTTLTKNFHREPYYHYTLQATVPSLAVSAKSSPIMPLLLDVTDENGQCVHMKSVDHFTYLDSLPYTQYPVSFDISKKRKYADNTSNGPQLPAKRSASTPLQPKGRGIYPSISDANLYDFESNLGLYALPGEYDRPVSQSRSSGGPVVQRPSYRYLGSPHVQPSGKPRSTSTSRYGGQPSMGHLIPSPRLSTSSQLSSRHERVSSASSNPPLIRTSILQPQATTSFQPPGFNPYTIYPTTKAKLEIQGDLQTMCEKWTTEEVQEKRRLVEFHRRQEDSIIHTSFKPVKLDERTQGTHCVSCILWEERNECFVTSVDTIQLLEGLVGVRFTVEEKNRIRRNLEGFKPLTVSKQKEDSETFFRLIMGFPNPKPRNIEKDVKVFPWSILGNALRKIISKYSASYASTSAILAPSTNAGYGSSIVESSLDHRTTASPQSTASSAASHTYRYGMTTTAVPPSTQASVGMEVITGSYEPLRQTSQTMPAMSHWPTPYSTVSGLSHYATGHGMYEPGHAVHVAAAPAHQPHYYPTDATTEQFEHTDDKYYAHGDQPS